MIAFSVLALPYILFVSGELQKTAIGIVLIFLFLLYAYRYTEEGKLHFTKIVVLILLIAFTHFGSFTVVLIFTIIFSLLNIRELIKWIKTLDVKLKVVFTLGILMLFTGIYLFDSARFTRLITIPFHAFDAPVIVFWFKGMDAFYPVLNIYTLLINFMAIMALVVSIRNKNKISKGAYRYILALIILTFILSSPLINTGLFWRFIIFSFIPITIIYLMLFRLINMRIIKYVSVSIFLLVILYSARAGLTGHRRASISKEAYTELQTLKSNIKLKSNSVVITRLFIGWWVAWEMNTDVSQDYAITESDLKKYNSFYVLRQINSKESFGNNILDTEVDIPSTAQLIYRGENFEFYELINKEDFNILPHEPPIAIGKISIISNGRFTISNGKLNYVVDYDGCLGDFENEEKVKVWGALRPFSTKIKAEKIGVTAHAGETPTFDIHDENEFCQSS